jgi:hypothetical protein
MDSYPLRTTVGLSLPEPEGDGAWARFSPCRRYRWLLGRRWRPGGATLLFIGLNPSRADGRSAGAGDDPTLRRLQAFARAWDYAALEVLNLFSWVSPDPRTLRHCPDPVGAETDAWIRSRLLRQWRRQPQITPALWLGWGNGGSLRGRDRQLLSSLQDLPLRPLCLGITRRGQPRHPLYAPRACCLHPYAPSWEQGPEPRAIPCPVRPAASPSI